MGSKPETVYYRSIIKLLPRELYVEKMYNPLKGGTPDLWLSGSADDLWIEVKFVNPIPVHVPIRIYKLLSPLQKQWLSERHKEGRNIAVLLGTPKGSVVIEDRQWEVRDVLVDETDWLTKQEIADYLTNRLMLT